MMLTKSPGYQSLNTQSEGFEVWCDAAMLKKQKESNEEKLLSK